MDTNTYTVSQVIEGVYEGNEIEVDAETHDGAVAAAIDIRPEINDPQAWTEYPNHVWIHTAVDGGSSVDWTGHMLAQWTAGEDVAVLAR